MTGLHWHADASHTAAGFTLAAISIARVMGQQWPLVQLTVSRTFSSNRLTMPFMKSPWFATCIEALDSCDFTSRHHAKSSVLSDIHSSGFALH